MYRAWLVLAILLAGCSPKPPPPRVGLTAERSGGSIRVRWNRGLEAKSAELRISDSTHLEVLPVDSALLTFGSVLYIARSSDVRFDLDLNLDGKEHLIDTVRLIDPGHKAAPQKPPITVESNEPAPSDRRRRSPAATRDTDFRLPPRDLRQIPPPRR